MDLYRYLCLKKRLSEKLPTVKEIDLYLGQYDQQDESQSLYTTPALYIEPADIEWQTLGMFIQTATFRFAIHVVHATFFDNERRITDLAMGHFALVEQVYKALQGWSANLSYLNSGITAGSEEDLPVFETIERRRTAYDNTLSGVVVTVLEFECLVTDSSARPQYTNTTAGMQLFPDLVGSVN